MTIYSFLRVFSFIIIIIAVYSSPLDTTIICFTYLLVYFLISLKTKPIKNKFLFTSILFFEFIIICCYFVALLFSIHLKQKLFSLNQYYNLGYLMFYLIVVFYIANIIVMVNYFYLKILIIHIIFLKYLGYSSN